MIAAFTQTSGSIRWSPTVPVVAYVEVTRTINASPEEVWALVSDPTRYGEWSPENTGAKWVGDSPAPGAGAKFKGTNASGRMKWSTVCTVTHHDENEHFGFSVRLGPMPVADWSYQLEAAEEGTRVTESWTLTEPKAAAWLIGKAMRIPDRPEHARQQMAATLDAMAASLEN